MEIYNEEINDLLAPENRKLQVHENIEVCLDYLSTFELCMLVSTVYFTMLSSSSSSSLVCLFVCFFFFLYEVEVLKVSALRTRNPNSNTDLKNSITLNFSRDFS